jgi:hypothetical protein
MIGRQCSRSWAHYGILLRCRWRTVAWFQRFLVSISESQSSRLRMHVLIVAPIVFHQNKPYCTMIFYAPQGKASLCLLKIAVAHAV